MKMQSEPWALGFFAGIIILLLGLLVNDGCANAKPILTMPAVSSWTVRSANAVRVDTDCGSGSGVLTDDWHVVTAHHVVNCNDWPSVRLSVHVKIITASGFTREAFYDRFDGERDLVRLRLAKAVPDVPTLTVAHAYKGELVCAATATPTRTFVCGAVSRPVEHRAYGDLEIAGTNVWFGNSGAGVFNVKGELLGLVVRLQWCNDYDREQWKSARIKPKKTCGSNMTSLYDSTVLP